MCLPLTGQYIQCSDSCINDASDLIVFPNFVTEEEESGLMTEIDKTWRHTKYEYSHWDEVCVVIITKSVKFVALL